MRRRRYPFDENLDSLVREAWNKHLADRKGLSRAITDLVRRIGYPRYILRQRAQRLCLTNHVMHRWTEEERDYLREHAGEMSVRALAKHLGHSPTKVREVMARMKLSRRITAGYSGRELVELLGVCHRTVADWEYRGLLKRRLDRFSDVEVLRFLRCHPEEYDLRKVEQSWFKATVFPTAPCFMAGHAGG